jgi:TrmH family RNA methyltransferase
MTIKRIESPKNKLIREALEVGTRRGRHGERAFLIEGPHLLEEALGAATGTELFRVFYTERFRKRHAALWRRLTASGAELVHVSDTIMDKLADTETPPGVAAIAGKTEFPVERLSLSGITVVADGIRDPGNLGTLIRTADAVGAGAVVLLGTCDPYSPKALRASSGSVFHLPLATSTDDVLLDCLRKKKVPLLVAVAHGDIPVFEVEAAPPLAIAFGNEAAGVRNEILTRADGSLSVPIFGRAESLNVASAAAVVLYELARRGPRSACL